MTPLCGRMMPVPNRLGPACFPGEAGNPPQLHVDVSRYARATLGSALG